MELTVERLGELMQDHQIRTKMYSIILNILHNREDAQDLLQHTYIRAYNQIRSHGGFVSVDNPLRWLYVTARNNSITELRKLKGRKVEGLNNRDIKSDELDVLSKLSCMELEEKIMQTLQIMEPKYRNPLTAMLDNPDITYLELMRIAGVNSIGTLKSNIYRGRRKLREILEKNAYLS